MLVEPRAARVAERVAEVRDGHEAREQAAGRGDRHDGAGQAVRAHPDQLDAGGDERHVEAEQSEPRDARADERQPSRQPARDRAEPGLEQHELGEVDHDADDDVDAKKLAHAEALLPAHALPDEQHHAREVTGVARGGGDPDLRLREVQGRGHVVQKDRAELGLEVNQENEQHDAENRPRVSPAQKCAIDLASGVGTAVSRGNRSTNSSTSNGTPASATSRPLNGTSMLRRVAAEDRRHRGGAVDREPADRLVEADGRGARAAGRLGLRVTRDHGRAVDRDVAAREHDRQPEHQTEEDERPGSSPCKSGKRLGVYRQEISRKIRKSIAPASQDHRRMRTGSPQSPATVVEPLSNRRQTVVEPIHGPGRKEGTHAQSKTRPIHRRDPRHPV